MKEIPDLTRAQASIVARFARWLRGPRIMRRLLLGLAGFITVIAIIYARVNFHGKAEWEKTKRELAARGEVLDWSTFAPQPIPDDQNIFKAPKIAEWFGDNRGLITAPLDQRITNDFARRMLSANLTADIKTSQEADDFLAWSDQFENDFDTIARALKRPYARLVEDYSQPLSITFPNVTALNAVVKTIVQRAKCYLVVGQADKAWQELTLLDQFPRMVENQGKFVTTEGAWMRRELSRHSLQVIAKALELHAWQEPQLATLQQRLGDNDFITQFTEALRCGRALAVSSLEIAASDDSNLYKAAFIASGDTFWARLKRRPEFLLIRLAPRGTMYERATGLSLNFQTMINSLTPTDGIIRPASATKAFSSWRRAQQGLPALLQAQTLVNEAQIACALERYRLVNGAYPQALDALVPQFIPKLPRDFISGQPLIYHHQTENDRFLLYSVGWNETDDGGKGVSSLANPESLKEGDWVWGHG